MNSEVLKAVILETIDAKSSTREDYFSEAAFVFSLYHRKRSASLLVYFREFEIDLWHLVSRPIPRPKC